MFSCRSYSISFSSGLSGQLFCPAPGCGVGPSNATSLFSAQSSRKLKVRFFELRWLLRISCYLFLPSPKWVSFIWHSNSRQEHHFSPEPLNAAPSLCPCPVSFSRQILLMALRAPRPPPSQRVSQRSRPSRCWALLGCGPRSPTQGTAGE